MIKSSNYHNFHVIIHHQVRLDRPIAAHINICPGGLKEDKDGNANLVKMTSSQFFN